MYSLIKYMSLGEVDFERKPFVVGKYIFNPIQVEVEGDNFLPTQSIVILTYEDKTECYLALKKGEEFSLRELTQRADEVRKKLDQEKTDIDYLNQTDRLYVIGTCLDKYEATPFDTNLSKARQNFLENAKNFPQIKENLNQVELAATYRWQVQKNNFLSQIKV